MRWWRKLVVRLPFNIICVLFPAIVFIAIWLPPILHYYVPSLPVDEKMIEAGRKEPDDSVLNEIEDFVQSKRKNDVGLLIVNAEQILKGKLEISHFPTTSFTFPFSKDDLDKKSPRWQLFFASLTIPYTLLRVYQESGKNDFLVAACDMISAFARYERSVWLPKGLLWNDHAIAARIPVLAEFWKLYRRNPHYDPKVARDIFQLVARSAELLAKPSHFTYLTNHGIMQNIALLQIYLAFPTLTNVDKYKELALKRLHDQMPFYINDEGVVLEHSAEYHKAGINFLSLACRYLALANEPIPKGWKSKYEKAKDFYSQLRRPDGSLPPFGDTHARAHALGPIVALFDAAGKSQPLQPVNHWTPKKANSLYPVAGYSIWWNGLYNWPNEDKLSQTVVAWSYFSSNAHKHADEMSVLLWAGRHNWWTNVGYWPYGKKGRLKAVSWAGSNAPHLTNESTHSRRQTRILGYAWSKSLTAIDLERKGPDGYAARRQVLQVRPSIWIVLDHTFGNEDQRTTTTWTTSARVNLSKSELPGSYILETEGSNLKLTKFVIVSEGTDIRQYKGSFLPFAGWESHRPAPAIVIEQPAKNSWAAAIWLLQESDGERDKFKYPPFMEYWKNSANWQIELPLTSGLMRIWRKDDRVFVHQDARGINTQKELQLLEPPQISDEIFEIYRAYEKAAMKYPQKNYSLPRHLKATYLILMVFLLQEVFFFFYKKVGWRHYKWVRMIGSVGWVTLGLWVSSHI